MITIDTIENNTKLTLQTWTLYKSSSMDRTCEKARKV